MTALLTGCAGVLPQIERTTSKTLVDPQQAALAEAARDAKIALGRSGVWPLLQASHAFDARLASATAATSPTGISCAARLAISSTLT